jgi:transcriptional regulator with XRE-family HTH domain
VERLTKGERALALLQGSRLREARLAAGLTLEQVGDQVGVGLTTVRSYEVGRTLLRPYIALQLAPIVQRDAAFLLAVDKPRAATSS